MAAKSASGTEYLAFEPAARLLLARDVLRAREEDHYRAFLATPPDQVETSERLKSLKSELEHIQTEVKALEAEVG